MKQRPLFDVRELPMKLRPLTDAQIEQLANKYFGNMDAYWTKQIWGFARAIEKKIEGRNK